MKRKLSSIFVLNFLLLICGSLFACSNFSQLEFLVSYDENSGERVAYLFSNGIENEINEEVKISITENKKFNYKYKKDGELIETFIKPNQFHCGFKVVATLFENYSLDDLVSISTLNGGYLPNNYVYRYDVQSLNYKKEYNATINEDCTGITLNLADLAFPNLKEFTFEEVGPLFDFEANEIINTSELEPGQECYFGYYYGSNGKESCLVPCGIEVNINF